MDRQGVLWIGTSGGGIARYQGGTYDFLQHGDGLAGNSVRTIAEDREGSLWVGTRTGLSQISDVKFPIQSATDDMKTLEAISVVASRRGGVWITSSAGVTRFDPETKSYTTQSGLPNPYTKRVFEANNGDLYVASGSRDLVVFSGGKLVAQYAAPDMIVGMAEDGNGVVVSAGGELYRAGTNYLLPYPFDKWRETTFLLDSQSRLRSGR